jgi:ribose transport system substrate-binding protein
MTRRGLAIAVAATALVSALSIPAWAAGKKVGFASREIIADYNRGIIEGARRVIEAAGDTMVVVDGQGDPRKHNENIENLVNSHVDGIIIELGDALQLAPVVAKAKAAGIPVVTTSIGALTDGALTDVGGDDSLMSELMSRALLESINYQGDVYVFSVPGAPILETRKRVLEAMAKSYPNIRLHDMPTEHSVAKVQSQMEDILTANPDPGSIAAVWGSYTLLVSGAVQAIRQAGRNEIKVGGIDADRIGFQMLLDEGGPFIAAGGQNVPLIGQLAGEGIEAALSGKTDLPKSQMTESYLAVRGNAVAAAEASFGKSIWTDLKMDPAEVAKKFPQNQPLLMMRAPAP